MILTNCNISDESIDPTMCQAVIWDLTSFFYLKAVSFVTESNFFPAEA